MISSVTIKCDDHSRLLQSLYQNVVCDVGGAPLHHDAEFGPVHRFDEGPYRVEAQADRPRGRTVRVSAAIVDADGRSLVQAKGLFLVRPSTFE